MAWPRDSEYRSASHSVITKEILATRWGIGLESAARALNVTSQNGIRKVVLPVERPFRTKQSHLHFPTLDGKFFSDTMFPHPKSVRGHSCAQLMTNGKGYTHSYPMKAKSEAPDALMDFIHESGVPTWLVVDNAPEQNHARWNKIQREFHIQQTNTEPYSPWQNRAEGEIRELKKMIKRLMLHCISPKCWCFAGELVAAIRRLTALDHPLLRGRVPHEVVHGDTPDISEYDSPLYCLHCLQCLHYLHCLLCLSALSDCSV